MNEQQAKELLTRYRNGECSEQEQLLVNKWIEQEVDRGSWNISDEEKIQFGVNLKNAIDEARDHVAKKPTLKILPRIAKARRIAAAAAVLLIAGLSIFFYSRYTNTLRHSSTGQNLGLASHDIKPGSNKAYLILSNGKRLSLTHAANGAIAKEAGAEITKTTDGQVVYKTASDISGRHPEFSSRSRTNYSNALNTIETPRGGQYQVRLPDGSKVWLNAASKLIYPVTFTGRGQREVTLSGEAYFEVAKDKSKPFLVHSVKQDVQVLGTHFNINTYDNEPEVKTTLLEGAVRVNTTGASKQVENLRPGEQAVLSSKGIKVAEVNPINAIDWKNDEFRFKGEPLSSILRKVSRWYDVEIVYRTEIKEILTFSGSVSRFDNVSSVLKMLEEAGDIHFSIKGKIIYVDK